MIKKVLSVILTLLLLISCIPVSVSAEEIGYQLSGDGEVTIAGEKGESYYVIFSVEPVNNVQGLQIRLNQNTTNLRYIDKEFNSDIVFSNAYLNNAPYGSQSAVQIGMLFDLNGQDFSEKTDLVKLEFSIKNKNVVNGVSLGFSIEEFYDSSSEMNELDHNLITARVEKKGDEPTLSSITVKAPNKTNYFIGDSLDTTGMTVTANYSDNTTKDVTSDASLSGFDSTTSGTKTVTVKYQDKSATFKVTVSEPEPTLTKIEITSLPDKTTYYIGEYLDLTGLVITASYSDGTQSAVTEFSYSGFESTTAGTKTVTVKYLEKTASFDVTVLEQEVTLMKIEITSLPDKTTYYVDEPIDLSGLVITAIYSDGTKKDVTNEVTVDDFDSSTPGKRTLTFNYEGFSVSCVLTIVSPEVTVITLSSLPKKREYFIGEPFDPEGIKVIAYYDNDTTADVTSYVSYSGFDSATAGTKTVTVEYKGQTVEFDVTVSEKKAELTKIEITSMPDKTTYIVGESLDLGGLAVTATYSDGTTKDVTDEVTVSDFDSSAPGTRMIIVTFGGFSASFDVTVVTVEITGITVSSLPEKLEYYVGESFDPTGIKVTASYNNGTTADVTSDVTYSGFDSTTAGLKTVIVKYQEKTALFNVTVSEKVELTKIEITSSPDKTTYYVGESLDLGGLAVTATYSDATTKDVTDEVTVSDFDSSTTGTKTIIITYGGFSASFDVTVVPIEVTGITISSLPEKVEYFVGESFDPKGIKVTASYNNGATADVTNDVSYSGFDSTTSGTKNVTVSYQGKTAAFKVTVSAITVTKIEVTSLPAKTIYYVGEKLDTSGIVIIAEYNNGSTENVTENSEIGSLDSSTPGLKTITVTYENCTASFTVTVLPIEVTGISIDSKPSKLEYFVGDDFDPSGIKVTAAYSNGTTADVTSDVTYSGFDSSSSGNKTVTVTYDGCTASFSVTVKAAELIGISIDSKPSKLEYYVGDDFDPSGIKVTAAYSNGTTADVTSDVTYSGFDSSSSGNKTVTVTYDGCTASFNVTVKAAELTGISIDSKPSKLEYYVGDDFDPSGIKVTAAYSNGTTADVTSDVTYSGFDSETAGTKTVTVKYQDKTASFTVTVLPITVTKIEITSMPEKTEYYIGESLDTSGLVVTAEYNNGKTEDVTSDSTIGDFDSSTPGTKTITVTYGTFTASFNVTVKAAELIGISIDSKPSKLEYFVGDDFDPSGIKVTAAYNNGTTADVTDDVTYSGFDSSSAGTKTITVTYQGKTASFTVTVSPVTISPVTVTKIEITNMPSKTTYYVGEELDLSGLSVTAFYSDGTSGDVTDLITVTGFDSSVPGEQVIKVSYDNVSAEFKVNIVEKKGPTEKGDIDGDGKITTGDAIIILRYIAKLSVDEYRDYEEIMDVDHDGVITTNDAVMILRYNARIITSFD